MDLFDENYRKILSRVQPLASRIRPKDFNGFLGQKHIVEKNSPLRKAIEEDNLHSAIFYGPPGTGKTTLARIVRSKTKSEFKQISAVTSNVKELRETIETAKENLKIHNKKTIVFIDEIHRFNKSQQDALLPAVEDGLITLIGATTENPFFEVNSPLISRSAVFEFIPLVEKEMKELINNALKKDPIISKSKIEIKNDVLDFIVQKSNGDARFALNTLEAANDFLQDRNKKIIDIDLASQAMQKKAIKYDKGGDAHFNTISAFIKSLRGSDPNAAVYYLARMIVGGEDPKFIARRMIVFASEDIGNADPSAITVSLNAAQALEYVGLPEARINLAQSAIYLATAPKSNSAISAIDTALKEANENPDYEVPRNLQEGGYPGAEKLGRGIGYKYPHSFGGYVKQQYLPDEIREKEFYKPIEVGYEKLIAKYLKSIKKLSNDKI